MKKRILKFFVKATILAVIVLFITLYFNYYKVHFLFQPFNVSYEYEDTASYNLSIKSAACDMGSWETNSGTLNIIIQNSGESAVPNYCDVALILVDSTSGEPEMIGIDTDTRNWTPGLSTISIPIDFKKVGYGYYAMYLRIWDDSTTSDLPLNNSLDLDKNGYYIGSVTVSHIIH